VINGIYYVFIHLVCDLGSIKNESYLKFATILEIFLNYLIAPLRCE